jgi:HK97 family phage portal protein
VSILDRLIPWRRKSASTLDIFREVYGGMTAKSGASVDWKTALQVTTVLACARVIAEGIAQVPLKLYRESADGKTRLPAKEHPLYRLLHRRPNQWQTSFEYRETLAMHCVLAGNHYSYISRLGGKIVELIPFEPQWVTVKRYDDGGIEYRVQMPNGAQQIFPASSIWHIKGASWDSIQGMDAVKLAREAIGLAIATEEHHAKLHANGAKPSGLLSVEGTMTEAQEKTLRGWLERNYEGSANAFRTMIMDRQAKWTSLAQSGLDSEHLATRKFQIEEICRALRVLPIMVGCYEKASTYASAEQMFLAHVTHTLAPWYERIEQSIDAYLLSEKDNADGLYVKFVEEGLLRGAMADTADYLTKLVNGGIIVRNEARARLDLNPIEGLDEPLLPANMLIDGNVSDSTTDVGTPQEPA